MQSARRRFLFFLSLPLALYAVGVRWFRHRRPHSATLASLDPGDPIVRAEICPAIGVSRVGNSVDPVADFFYAPEVDSLLNESQVALRDGGRLRRQAQRFRVYGYTESGKVIELNSDNSQIEWTVHMVNKKAAWYRFDVAMDIEEAQTANTMVSQRNPGKPRAELVVDPGPRKISGILQRDTKYRLNGGSCLGIQIELGELRTDEKGRLVVLGGMGKAGTPDPARYPVFNEDDWSTFNNADGWWDDISDGSVHAEVKVEGLEQPIPVDPAWVIVAPPNYAPQVRGFRSFYDLLVNLYLEKKPEWLPGLKKDEPTSFSSHIQPLLERMASLQWVNKGFLDAVGAGGKQDLAKKMKSLSRKDSDSASLRKSIFNSFRVPGLSTDEIKNHERWPMLYGDAYGTFDESPRARLIVPDIQAAHLKNWRDGNFIDDYQPVQPPRSLDEVPLEKQPEMLTRAALSYCLADAFHPGCEITWPMRNIHAYRAPFRIKERTIADPIRDADYGPQLGAKFVMQEGGPLYEQAPGDLTKWMALPWHGDTAFCRSGYDPEINAYLPTFWPATVPNHVLSEEDYQIVLNKNKKYSEKERRDAFARRSHWLRMLEGGPAEQILAMVGMFSEVGVLQPRPGPGDLDFPPVLLVESLGPQAKANLQKKSAVQMTVPKSAGKSVGKGVSKGAEDKITKAGWDSADQWRRFRAVRFRGKNP